MKYKYQKVSNLLPRNKGIESKYLEIKYRPSPNNSNYDLNKSCDTFLNTLAYADLKRDRKRVKQVIEKFYEVLVKCNNINEIINFDKLLKKTYKQGGYAAIFYESADKMLNKEGKTLAEKLLDEIKLEKKYGPIADFSEPFFIENEKWKSDQNTSSKVVKVEQNYYTTKRCIDILKDIQKEYQKEEKKRERKKLAQRAYRARVKLRKLAGLEKLEPPKPKYVPEDTISLLTELDNFLKEKNASLEKTTTVEILDLLNDTTFIEKINKTVKLEPVKEETPILEETKSIKYLDTSEQEEAIQELELPDALERHEERVQNEIVKEDYLTRCEFAFNKVARFTHTRIKSDMEIKNLLTIHNELLKEMDKYKTILSNMEQEEITKEINNNINYLTNELNKLNSIDTDIDLYI